MTTALIMDISTLGQAGFSTIPVGKHLWENPPMSNAKEILRSRLRERLEITGKSMHAVSKAIGANAGYVRDLLDPEKASMPGAERLLLLAAELETTSDYLIGRVDAHEPVMSEATLAEHRLDWHGPSRGEPGIPLVGTGDCADLELVDDTGKVIDVERYSFDPEYHVRYIERPPALTGDSSLYAIYFNGSSMEPRFFAGEIGIVQPSRPPGPGDYVVVQINNGHGPDVVTVLVKRLVRQNSKEVVLEQHNPPLTFSLPKQMVVRIHRIMRPSDLLLR